MAALLVLPACGPSRPDSRNPTPVPVGPDSATLQRIDALVDACYDECQVYADCFAANPGQELRLCEDDCYAWGMDLEALVTNSEATRACLAATTAVMRCTGELTCMGYEAYLDNYFTTSDAPYPCRGLDIDEYDACIFFDWW